VPTRPLFDGGPVRTHGVVVSLSQEDAAASSVRPDSSGGAGSTTYYVLMCVCFLNSGPSGKEIAGSPHVDSTLRPVTWAAALIVGK
jgi:hypothetical protein